MGSNVSTELALRLMRQLTETVQRLAALSEADLERPVDHGCAMDGGLRRLLVHNAEHERQHAAPVSMARQRARDIPERELPRLIRDLIHQRAEMVGLLLGMDDAVLDTKAPNDEWTVREHIDHLLFWENDTMEAAGRDLGVAPPK